MPSAVCSPSSRPSALDLVADCTVEGLLHAPSCRPFSARGHGSSWCRTSTPSCWSASVPTRARGQGQGRDQDAASGIDDDGDLARRDRPDDRRVEAPAGSSWGYTSRPGTIAHWPGGLCLCFPAAGSVNGTLVIDNGDVNLTFKRYMESPVD